MTGMLWLAAVPLGRDIQLAFAPAERKIEVILARECKLTRLVKVTLHEFRVNQFHCQRERLNAVEPACKAFLNSVRPMDCPSALIFAARSQCGPEKASSDSVIAAFKGAFDERLVTHAMSVSQKGNDGNVVVLGETGSASLSWFAAVRFEPS